MRKCSLHIGYAIYDCLAIEDNGWIAIHTILHRFRQTYRGALHPRTISLTQLLEALQNDSFGLFRISWKAFGQLRLGTPDAIQFIDMEFFFPTKRLAVDTSLTGYMYVSRGEYFDEVRMHFYRSIRLYNTSEKGHHNQHRHNKAY